MIALLGARSFVWAIWSGCRCSAPSRAGRAISARGQRRDSGSSASRVPFDSPITARCSSGRAWGTSWRSTGWSTPHRKRARVPTAFTGAGGSALPGLGQAPDPHSYRKALSGSAASCVCHVRKRGPFCALSRTHPMLAPAQPLG